MNKKGQLTIFIIIGIVLLFSTALIFFIRDSVTEYQPRPGIDVILAQVPIELQPLHRLVSECLEQTAEDAVLRVGLQGGYSDTTILIANDQDPTEGNAVSFSPGADLKIPFWWYLRSRNTCEGDCEFASERLELEGIEEQISDFITRRLPTCLDFNDFIERGFVIEPGEITPDVTIGRVVSVVLDYPLTVRLEGREEVIRQYVTSVDVNLDRIHEFATSITNAEINYGFFERQTIHVISSFAGLEKEIPPLSESDFKPGAGKLWQKSKVEELVSSLLTSYVPVLQVMGTRGFIEPISDNRYKQGIYSTMVLPIVGRDQQLFEEFSTNFNYFDWWPIYFNIKGRGSRGEIIGPEEASSSFFSFIGIKRYENFYDVSYPVLIEIKDDDALEGRGYTFLFAIEVNLRNNDPVDVDYEGLPTAPIVGGSLLCNDNQRNSGNITITTPTEDALINFVCGTEACLVGYTESDGVLKTKLPICAGGVLVASKAEYFGAPVEYSSQIDKSDDINLELFPIIEKNIKVQKKPVQKRVCHNRKIRKFNSRNQNDMLDEATKGALSSEIQRVGEKDIKCFWFFKDEPEELLNNELAIITLTKVKETAAEEDFISTLVYNGSVEFTTARLVPGSYEVRIDMFYSIPSIEAQTLIIPSREIVVDKNWIIPGGKESTTLDPIEFDESFPEGGVDIVKSNGYWELTADKLYADNEIIFYAMGAPDFNVQSSGVITTEVDFYFRENFKLKKDTVTQSLRHEDVAQMGKLTDYTKLKREELEPRFTR